MYDFTHKNKRIIAVSDTHGRHEQLSVPPCDILIHLGDACNDGDMEQLRDFFLWFEEQNAKHKIFIAGNHDLIFDFNPASARGMIPNDIIYMENNIIKLDGLTIASVKATPWMHEMVEIDEPVDILLSHGTPLGILDDGLGCPKLRFLIEKCKPKYALFGHIHWDKYACATYDKTICVNVCNDSLLK